MGAPSMAQNSRINKQNIKKIQLLLLKKLNLYDSSYKSQTGCLHLADISVDLLIPLSAVCPPDSLMCSLSGLLTSLTPWIVSPLRDSAPCSIPSTPPRVTLGKYELVVRGWGKACFSLSLRAALGGCQNSDHHCCWFSAETKSPNPSLSQASSFHTKISLYLFFFFPIQLK